ncbi:MAG TPA: vitamin K epoxide reductase family protein [Anaerolineaceae bacterium]|nr:vitamin K epoxide reductase family protein [Anaerolineaceae bacterium]
MDQDKTLRRIAIVLSIIGLGVALYLLSIKLTPVPPYCFGLGDCETVNTSKYSEILGIPIALLGGLAYATILALLLLETGSSLIGKWGILVEFGMTLGGTLYSAFLTFLEVAVIKAICPYCVTSAIVMTLLFVITIIRMARQL